MSSRRTGSTAASQRDVKADVIRGWKEPFQFWPITTDQVRRSGKWKQPFKKMEKQKGNLKIQISGKDNTVRGKSLLATNRVIFQHSCGVELIHSRASNVCCFIQRTNNYSTHNTMQSQHGMQRNRVEKIRFHY